ncbi:MAG TPA: hypothetical protein PKK06_03915 [Phycisphaerae bacterium]|nr:hypothetical protein [Phycisphaerae bacterium]HNU44912.1 hypothetical protein [Phycisphaerae bacterium]
MTLNPDQLDRMLGTEWHSPLPPVCPRCDYNLTGSVTNRCPECGYIFQQRELRRSDSNLRAQLLALRDTEEWGRLGFKLALVGVVLTVTGFGMTAMAGGMASAVGRVAAIACGLPSFFLGLGAIRVFRLPAWCREEAGVQTSPARAAATVLLALGLIAWGLFSPW